MKKSLAITFLLLFLLLEVVAQPAVIARKRPPYSWMFQAGWNIINDKESTFANLFKYDRPAEFMALPSKFGIAKHLHKKWSFESDVAYNRLQFRNTVMVPVNNKADEFVAVDQVSYGSLVSINGGLRFNFTRVYPPLKRFDPFAAMGVGITYKSGIEFPSYPTINGSIGANIWLNKHWAVQVVSSGRLSVLNNRLNPDQNYLALSMSIAYCVRYKQPAHYYNGDRHYKWIKK